MENPLVLATFRSATMGSRQGVNVAVDLDHEWEVNHDTGVILHPEPLPNGAVLSANFEFDVPVWFEGDEIGFSLQAYEPESGDSIYRLESVFVVEGRIPFTLPWAIENATEITEPLDLGIIYDTTEKHSFSTDKLALSSGFIRREVKREDTLNLVDIGDRVYNREELDRLLSYFYACRGQSRQFLLTDKQKNYLANITSDRLNIKFLGTNNSDALFSMSGLKLKINNYSTKILPQYGFFLDPRKDKYGYKSDKQGGLIPLGEITNPNLLYPPTRVDAWDLGNNTGQAIHLSGVGDLSDTILIRFSKLPPGNTTPSSYDIGQILAVTSGDGKITLAIGLKHDGRLQIYYSSPVLGSGTKVFTKADRIFDGNVHEIRINIFDLQVFFDDFQLSLLSTYTESYGFLPAGELYLPNLQRVDSVLIYFVANLPSD